MQFIYHRVPENMTGDRLIPLNLLKDIYPDIYFEQIKKYAGREVIMRQTIPTLNCLWNDVLHLSAIHPNKINQALREIGFKVKKNLHYYEIDANLLEPENTTIFLDYHNNKDGTKKLGELMVPENFVVYDPENLEEYSTVPEETKSYYKRCFFNKTRVLSYQLTAHILYQGSINIKNVRIITI